MLPRDVPACAPSPPSPFHRLRAEVDLPVPTALWVLGAHLVTLLSPLTLVAVAHARWQQLAGMLHAPGWLFVAAALLLVGSAFECAQNTLDRWYLTPETGSAYGVGLCDFAFWGFTCLGMAAIAYAAAGELSWLMWLAGAGLGSYPLLYLWAGLPYPSVGATAVAAALALYLRADDPMAFMLVVFPAGVLMVFFSLLLRTGNQVLHGFATLSSGVGLALASWALDRAAAGTPHDWLDVLRWLGATGVVLGLAWPLMARSGPTPRAAGAGLGGRSAARGARKKAPNAIKQEPLA